MASKGEERATNTGHVPRICFRIRERNVALICAPPVEPGLSAATSGEVSSVNARQDRVVVFKRAMQLGQGGLEQGHTRFVQRTV